MKFSFTYYWVFSVLAGLVYPTQLWAQSNSNKLHIKGSMQAQIRYYETSQATGTRPTFVSSINANPTLYYGEWRIPVRIVFGNYQTYFRDYNRYGIAPEYRNLKIYAGHTTLQWSSLVLDSRPILGAGFEYKPRKIRMGIFAGFINRSADSATYRGRFFVPVYRRNMISGILGFGDKYNFIELVGLGAKDVFTSLDPKKTLGISPQANGILGLNLGYRIHPRFQLKFNTALSANTENTQLTGNEINGFKAAKIPGIFVKSNQSTTYSVAFSGNATFALDSLKILKFRFAPMSNTGVQFDRIDPKYQSMGLYFLIPDIQRFRWFAQVRSKSGTYFARISLGTEKNNIIKSQNFTNRRKIGGIIVGFRTGKNWSHQINFQNYSTQLTTDAVNINDSLVLNLVNQSFTLNSSGNIKIRDNPRQISFGLGVQNGKNITTGSAVKNLMHRWISTKYTWNKSDNSWNYSVGYELHQFTTIVDTTTRHIPGFSLNRELLQKKLSLQLESGILFTWYQHKYNTTSWRNLVSVQWRFVKKQSLQLNIIYQPNFAKANKFNEFQADIRWVVRF